MPTVTPFRFRARPAVLLMDSTPARGHHIDRAAARRGETSAAGGGKIEARD